MTLLLQLLLLVQLMLLLMLLVLLMLMWMLIFWLHGSMSFHSIFLHSLVLPGLILHLALFRHPSSLSLVPCPLAPTAIALTLFVYHSFLHCVPTLPAYKMLFTFR